ARRHHKKKNNISRTASASNPFATTKFSTHVFSCVLFPSLHRYDLFQLLSIPTSPVANRSLPPSPVLRATLKVTVKSTLHSVGAAIIVVKGIILCYALPLKGNPVSYELLVLADTLGVGRAREQKVAESELKRRFQHALFD
ncbi:MAG: hypothetical protein WCS94_17270, partial [Verrucomicrobiota bacterium]